MNLVLARTVRGDARNAQWCCNLLRPAPADAGSDKPATMVANSYDECTPLPDWIECAQHLLIGQTCSPADANNKQRLSL
jgi:hypothetical protein